MSGIAVCCVTSRIAGDSDACGDCDPCLLGANGVPDVVKRLIKEKDEWRERYSDCAAKLDEMSL